MDAKTDKKKVQELSQRRSEDFLRMNHGLLRDFGVRGQVGASNGDIGLWLETDNPHWRHALAVASHSQS